MSEYLILNIAIAIVPLLLTFEKKLKFYKNIPAVLLSILIVGSVFVVWDVLAAVRGDWSFNENYVLGITVFNLPLEEILFFITVPYSIIFLYETAKFYLGDKQIVYNKKLFTAASIFFVLGSLFFYNQYYTFTVLMFTGLFFILAMLIDSSLLTSRLYWLFIFFTYIPFLVVNYFLTSLPVVTYNAKAIWGVRFITIPAEDFFYSFSLLSFNLFFYIIAKERWLKRKLL